MSTIISKVKNFLNNITRKSIGGKRRTSSKRAMSAKTSGGAGKMPTSKEASIKRAKKAIQKYYLDKTAAKKAIAEAEIANANAHCGDRKKWDHEMLIKSNKEFSDATRNSSWYLVTSSKQWSLEKMPDWAKNGNEEPTVGEKVKDTAYFKGAKSAER